jgi:DNA-binding transcriptional ArsR family regulator
MTDQERVRSESRAAILKALGHPSRLFMVEKLSDKPYCVCELTAMIGADTSTVSKHLSILKNAGIVSIRKEGTTVYYSLEAPCVMKLLRCVETVAKRSLEGQLASLRLVSARGR